MSNDLLDTTGFVTVNKFIKTFKQTSLSLVQFFLQKNKLFYHNKFFNINNLIIWMYHVF